MLLNDLLAMATTSLTCVSATKLHLLYSNLVFPRHCRVYIGASRVKECYETIWNQAGCVSEGYSSPANISNSEMNHLDRLTLP